MLCPVCGQEIGDSWCPACVGTKKYMELMGEGDLYKKNEEAVKREHDFMKTSPLVHLYRLIFGKK